MAKIGLEPMKPYGGGFTVRCRCHWTTLPNYQRLSRIANQTEPDGFEPSKDTISLLH